MELSLEGLKSEIDEIKSFMRLTSHKKRQTDNLALGGLKSYYISDKQLSSSGYFQNLETHSHIHARLDSNTGVGGWAGATADKNDYQWVQVDLYKPKKVYGVIIQGRSQIQQWVTKFKVQYGNDENSLQYVESFGKPMVFDGATDPQTAHPRNFPRPIEARYIRIVVADFYNHPCMRFDLKML